MDFLSKITQIGFGRTLMRIRQGFTETAEIVNFENFKPFDKKWSVVGFMAVPRMNFRSLKGSYKRLI